MRKKVVNDLIGTSTEILQTFWHKDMSLLSHYLDDDVFYCGADPSQYYSSKNELVNYFLNCKMKLELRNWDKGACPFIPIRAATGPLF